MYRLKAKFDCTDNEMYLNDVPFFRGMKCTSVCRFKKVAMNKTSSVSCANGFWQRKFGLKVDKT